MNLSLKIPPVNNAIHLIPYSLLLDHTTHVSNKKCHF